MKDLVREHQRFFDSTCILCFCLEHAFLMPCMDDLYDLFPSALKDNSYIHSGVQYHNIILLCTI